MAIAPSKDKGRDLSYANGNKETQQKFRKDKERFPYRFQRERGPGNTLLRHLASGIVVSKILLY